MNQFAALHQSMQLPDDPLPQRLFLLFPAPPFVPQV